MLENKKGLSPVIATVLLIMLAIILAVIIIIWASNFIGEQITKNLGAGEEEISTFCNGEDLKFVIDFVYEPGKISLTAQNNGNVPIYGFEVRQKKSFSIKRIADISFGSEGLLSGETKDAEANDVDLNTGDEVIVTPVLVGQSDNGKRYYTCDDKYGQVVTV